MRRIAPIHCLPVLLAAACNGGGAGSSSFGELPVTTASVGQSSSTGDESTGGSTAAVPEASTSAGSSGGGTTLVLDVGGPDLGGVGPEGCRGKIDFLFVISRFGTDVPDEAKIQNKLIAAAPKFLDTIQERFADFDYHIMVVDADDYWGDYHCTEYGCDHMYCDPDFPCELIESITPCDKRLGAGTIFNVGEGTLNKPCGVVEGKRYLDRDQPDIEETFECVARVGLDSGYDWPVNALVDAVTPEKTGDCNAGFLRDDALLFVTIASYTLHSAYPPQFSPGKPDELAQAIIDAKHGDAGAVVMLNIGRMSDHGWTDLESCAEEWYFGGGFTCRLLEFFPYRMVADAASPDYGVAFDQAVDLVDDACTKFVPR
jgi:hypothetical protein